MSELNLEVLLDIDELKDSQQEWLKGLITYEIRSSHMHNCNELTFKIIDKQYNWINFCYWIDGNDLDLASYKFIMFHLIEQYGRGIKDYGVIEDVQNALSQAYVGNPEKNRCFNLGGKTFIMGSELKVRSQDLFRAVELILGAYE